MSFIFVKGQPGDTAGIAARTTLPMGGGAAFTELQTDCDAPVSEFLWISNGLIAFSRLPHPMALKALNV
jgi:hypothetical protein